MAGYRQVDTDMWGDTWFSELESDEKLLFIYLFTNGRTSLSGLYEISDKLISFHTGLNLRFVQSTMAKFIEAEKIYREDGIIFVTNMLKRHKNKSPKTLSRIVSDIENTKDGNPKTVCKQRYKKLIRYWYSINTKPHEAEAVTETEPKAKSETEDVADGRNNNPNSKELITTFTEYTNLKPGKGADKLAEILVNAGVISEDIIRAVDYLRDHPPNKCVSFKSLETSACIERDKRIGKQKVDDKEDPRRYLKGPYGEVGVH